jgi:hypothetical protein
MMRGSSVRLRLPLAVGIVLLTAVAGCDKIMPPPSKMRFNDTICRKIKAIGKEASLMRKTLDPLAIPMGEPFDPGAVEAAYVKLGDIIKKTRAEAENMVLPRNPTAAIETMLEKYKEYLKDQERIWNTNVARIVAIAKDERKSKETRWKEIDQEIQTIMAEEEKTKGPLRAIQADLAKDMNWSLVPSKT